MQWPGTELRRSEWFADVQQSVIERRLTMSARDYIGHLSTISAYLELPASDQEQVYSRIMRVLPETEIQGGSRWQSTRSLPLSGSMTQPVMPKPTTSWSRISTPRPA